MADLTITARDGSGSFGGYLALPESGSGPGVIVIQEIFGVNAGMRRICDWLAGEGYVAFCPDLFWRIEPGIELTDKTDEEWQKAFELYKAFDVDLGIQDIAATLETLHSHDAVTRRIGAVGYCLGGLLAYLTACRTSVDASVSYYGVGIDNYLDEADSIAGYLLMHIAEEDQFVDKAAQKKIHEALDGNPRVTIYDYPGVDHAFARPDGINFNKEAAELANRRTLDFFAEHLKR